MFAWTLLILLGVAPHLATAWFAKASGSLVELSAPGALRILLLGVVIAWAGWRPLLRLVEESFWSLNALAVQPGYVLCREALRSSRSPEARLDAESARFGLATLLGVGLPTGCPISSRQPAVPSSCTTEARPLGIPNARFFARGDPAPIIAEARQAIERTPPYRR